MSPFYLQAIEDIDTTIYDLTIQQTNADYVGLCPRIRQICTDVGLYGLGARWVTDVSCKWVPQIDWYNGQSTLSCDASGNLSVSVTEVKSTYAAGHPITYSIPSDNFSSSNFVPASTGITYLGRNYYVSGNDIMMHDLVNDVEYRVGTIPVDYVSQHALTPYAVTTINGFLIIVFSPDFIAESLGTLNYPVGGGVPINDTIQLGVGSNIYGIFFRGIFPKATKHAVEPYKSTLIK